MTYIIYGTPQCGFCTKAKVLLEDNGIPYTYREVNSEEIKDELSEKLGFPARSVPQIFKASEGLDEYIGGFNELKSLVA